MAAPYDLSGKIALVTGGSRGLGRAMVLAFAEAGADVVIASRKLDACEAVAKDAKALGRRALALSVHAGQWKSMEALAERVYSEWGRVDILVNNAGMSPVAPSSVETSEELFDKVLGLNFKGPFRLTAIVGSRMFAGAGGSIINVSTLGARLVRPNIIPYAASKSALNVMTKGFSLEFAPKVRVNTISPGQFNTDIAKAWRGIEEMKRGIPLGRFGEPHEIVGAAMYLASDASSYTTGTNIEVGGGI